MKTIRIVTLVVLATGITLNPIMAINVMSLEDAAKKGLIKLFIKSKGGYSGEVIEMKIKNSSNKNLDFKLETGRKLDSKNNAEQDILVTKPQEFNVCGGQTRTINVFGMCCQAHNMCPRENSEYSIGTMADSTLIKLAMFIDKNKYYTNSSAQQAVWTVSDNNSLGSITDGNKVDVNNLRNFVSKITGKTIPPYEVTYSRENDRDLLGRVKTIEGTFDYALPDNTHVTIGIYNSDGVLVQSLFENIEHQKGEYKLYYTFHTINLPQGIYYARMDSNDGTKKEMKIEF